MAGRKKKKREPLFDDLAPHTKQAIGAVLFALLGAFFALALLGMAGSVGSLTYNTLKWLFGVGAYLAPVVCAFYVYALMRPRDDERVSISKIIGIALLFIALLGAFELYQIDYGGTIGWLVKAPLTLLIGKIAAGVTLGAIFIIGI